MVCRRAYGPLGLLVVELLEETPVRLLGLLLLLLMMHIWVVVFGVDTLLLLGIENVGDVDEDLLVLCGSVCDNVGGRGAWC